MKIIVLLAGYGSRMRPHTWSRAKALMKVAGNTVIGHLLNLMSDVTTLPDSEIIFVVGYKGGQIKRWIKAQYPELNTHFVTQKEAKGQAHAVWLCREHIQPGDSVIVAFGDGVIDADYAGMVTDADGVILTREEEDPRSFGVVALDEAGFVTDFIEKPADDRYRQVIVGINWFRDAAALFDAIETMIAEKRQTLGEYFMVDAYKVMLENGAKFVTRPVTLWEDAGQPQNILRTNRNLLATRYSSPDALERSYVDGFTVVPPVYIHPEAKITASVIGPYATIDADVTIDNAIVRNSIIDAGSTVQDILLDGALVGENARISGKPKALFVGDNSIIDLG